MIIVEDEFVWQTYCEAHEKAASYKNKTIEFWDYFVVLFGTDRATGAGAEHYDDANEAMRNENLDEIDEIRRSIGLQDLSDDNNDSTKSSRARPQTSTHSTQCGPNQKKVKKDHMANAIYEVANSIKDFLARKPTQPTATQVLDLISSVPGLSDEEEFKAHERLLNADARTIEMLSTFGDDKKKRWIQLLISNPPN